MHTWSLGYTYMVLGTFPKGFSQMSDFPSGNFPKVRLVPVLEQASKYATPEQVLQHVSIQVQFSFTYLSMYFDKQVEDHAL